MLSIQEQQKIQSLFHAALECSFYVSPNDPGLTYDELAEVGRRTGLQPGEISDGISAVVTPTFGGKSPRFLPNKNKLAHWHLFIHPEEPDYRNVEAFRFLWSQLRESGRANGVGNIRLERRMLIERAIAGQIKKLDIEVAIAIHLFTEQLIEESGIIKPVHLHGFGDDPTAHLLTMGNRPPHRREEHRKAYPLVKDIVERRTDGRPSAAEPFDAFADELTKLGYGSFQMWWKQVVAELRLGDTQTSSVSVTVLAAALVEGALTFVVKHARSLNLAVFRSSDFDGEPKTWKIEKLIASAASGGEAAVLDQPTKNRADGLVQTRQRIHAGRMLADFPGGAPDLKPEQARDSRATAEVVVRKVIEWLERYPPSTV